MATAKTVQTQIDATLKEDVAKERALPFEVRMPNSETRDALLAAQRGNTKRFTNVAGLMAELNDGEAD